ncbi:RDD family protein [Scleromatobacter humisilvae]|uniref:RDD family protein n=1 Tax=Scleromatobacter humisilvae TaxID=2897159 RepID=A0A9X2C3L9_9BURK|nr:RDD family protein [Scleromatobacter humisilvae]MCK9687740.1 RDD family protein [Scleromatobacter humisilvae]
MSVDALAGAVERQAEGVRYVGFWARLAAGLLDLILVLFVVIPVLVWLFGDGWTEGRGVVGFVVNWVPLGGAIIAFWVMKGATPGKMAISAVVVDAQTHSPVDFWQALTRYVGYFVSTIPLFAGLAWVAFDARKQGWHDKMARTVVVYRPR